MQVQLQELLETIKKDGVDSAEKEKKAIIAQAEDEAANIVATAEKQAENLKGVAEQDIKRFEESARAAVGQAGRDMLISVQKALEDSFNRVVETTVAGHFSGEALTAGIVSIVQSFNARGELMLSPEVLASIETNLKARLGAEIKAGLRITGSNLPGGGFILKEDGGRAYYDFSSKSIAEVIKARLSQQIADLINITDIKE